MGSASKIEDCHSQSVRHTKYVHLYGCNSLFNQNSFLAVLVYVPYIRHARTSAVLRGGNNDVSDNAMRSLASVLQYVRTRKVVDPALSRTNCCVGVVSGSNWSCTK